MNKKKVNWQKLPKPITKKEREQLTLDNRKKTLLWASFFRMYPDIYLDMIKPPNSAFELKEYQRVMLRVLSRYQYPFFTFTRGATKSFTAALQRVTNGVFRSGDKCRVVAGGSKEEGKNISSEKITEIINTFPSLELEIKGGRSGIKDSKNTFGFKLTNGSSYEVIGCSENSRGGRANTGIIEEAMNINKELYDKIIEPMFNVQRMTAAGYVDKNDFNEQVAYVTTSGRYQSPMCKQQIHLLDNMVKQEKYSGRGTCFVAGSSWELPVHFDMLTIDKVRKAQNDPNSSDILFRQEYGSEWVKMTSDCPFSYKTIEGCRSLVLPELEASQKEDDGTFYYISYDVARMGGTSNDNSVAAVFKAKELKNKTFLKEVVAMYHWHDNDKQNSSEKNAMHFKNQAMDLKELVFKYNAKALIVDGGGLGTGVLDFLTIKTNNEDTGEEYPAYGIVSTNFKDAQFLDDDVKNIIHVIKANDDMNAKMENCLTGHFQTRKIRILADWYTVEASLQNNPDINLDCDLEMYRNNVFETEQFISEITNLVSKVVNNKIKIKTKGNATKDRFTAVEYGVYWCKQYYEEKHKNETPDINMREFYIKANSKKGRMTGTGFQTKSFFN